MATHSSILAWRIPWMEEPGGLQSTGSWSEALEEEKGTNFFFSTFLHLSHIRCFFLKL